MKRFGLFVAAAVLTSVFSGCGGGGGVPAGMPENAASANPQPPGFEDMMKNQGKNMTTQKRPPAAPK